MLGSSIFYFNWYSSFSGTSLHSSLLLVLYSTFLININLIYVSATYKHYKIDILNYFPSLYKSEFISYCNNFVTTGINLANALFSGTFVYYFSAYISSRSLCKTGKPSNLTILSLVIYLSFFIGINFKLILKF